MQLDYMRSAHLQYVYLLLVLQVTIDTVKHTLTATPSTSSL